MSARASMARHPSNWGADPGLRVVGVTPVRDRVRSLDALRGAALVLAVLDHLLVVLDAPGFLRWGPTRFAFPVFMVLCGALLASRTLPSPQRCVELFGAAFLALPASAAAGLDSPDILLVLCVALFVRAGLWVALARASVALRHVVCAAVGLTLAWFVPLGWDGYEPGLVIGLLAVGGLAGPAALETRLRSRALEWLGRRPLRVWVCQAWAALVLVGLL